MSILFKATGDKILQKNEELDMNNPKTKNVIEILSDNFEEFYTFDEGNHEYTIITDKKISSELVDEINTAASFNGGPNKIRFYQFQSTHVLVKPSESKNENDSIELQKSRRFDGAYHEGKKACTDGNIAVRLEALLPDFEHGKETHRQWRDCPQQYRNENPDIGGSEFHDELVKVYDNRISVTKEAIKILKGGWPSEVIHG